MNALSSAERMNIPLTPPTGQENPKMHDIIPEITESLNEGNIIDGSSIMSGDSQIQNKARQNFSDIHSQKITIEPHNKVKYQKGKSQRSVNLAQRPIYKNNRALSKASERSNLF